MKFQGPYKYSKDVIEKWDSDDIGVYYCGTKNQRGGLTVFYVGKATGEGGIRSRLLDHIRDDYWADVTHFGIQICDTVSEAEDLERKKIAQHKPKYNKQG